MKNKAEYESFTTNKGEEVRFSIAQIEELAPLISLVRNNPVEAVNRAITQYPLFEKIQNVEAIDARHLLNDEVPSMVQVAFMNDVNGIALLIAHIAKTSQVLRDVDISMNDFHESTLEISEIFAQSTTINSLTLDCCKVGRHQTLEIAKTIVESFSMQHIYMGGLNQSLIAEITTMFNSHNQYIDDVNALLPRELGTSLPSSLVNLVGEYNNHHIEFHPVIES